MRKYKVAGIGELLWDMLPGGKQPGGAPLNFAFHATQLGCEGFILSAVGNDLLGDEIIEYVSKLNVSTAYIQKNMYPTGKVKVALDKVGKPTYTIQENVAWDSIEWNKKTEDLTKELDAVCWGTLAQRFQLSAQNIIHVISHLRPDCMKIFDINLRQHYFDKKTIETSLNVADILKLNDEELPVLQGFFCLNGDVENQLKQLANRLDLKYIIYTMGAKGSLILGSGKRSCLKSPKVKIADTVGAGDSFTAAIAVGLLEGQPIELIHKRAVRISAYVCTQNGANPSIPKNLLFQ